MKKLLLLVIVFLTGIINANAEGSQQYFASYTYGVQKLNIQNCLQTISNTGIPPATISVYAIVASDFDVTNVSNITLTAYTGFTISVDLPADRSAALTPTGLNFQTTKTADGTTSNYTLYIHKINKATIPYSLNFGSLFPYNTATPDFNGWGYRLLNNATTPQLASTSSTNSFFLAFNPSLSTDSLVCNYYASNNNTQTGLSGTINTSIDGVTWTTIKSMSNDLPANNATLAQKRFASLLPTGTQYVQFLLTGKASTDPAVNVNVIYVKHFGNITAVQTITDYDPNITINGHNLSIKNNLNYTSLQLISIQGKTIQTYNHPNSEISLPNLSKGLYIINARKNNGSLICKKVILK